MPIYKFRKFLLHTTERRVVKNGKYLELTPKTFDVLQLLVERCGEIVSKDEILGEVWYGSFVEEGNLPVHISKLRRSLDETKNEGYIETVQGSGYRFIAPVQTANEDDWSKHLPDQKQMHKDKSAKAFTFDSIAVLPLQNEQNDAEFEYLADGLTESIINSLAHLHGLKVIARNTVFRYKNKKAEPKEVGETLGVSAVLTGRIRVIKENLLISVELTNIAEGTQLWGTHFNQPFSDIVEVQEKIILEVSENLKSQIGSIAQNSLSTPGTNNAESYRLYLKGKYFLAKWTEEHIYKAIEYFQKSVSIDPGNILSYIEIVRCHIVLYGIDSLTYNETLIKIKPLLNILSKLNQSVDELQVLYGVKKMYLDWDFTGAEKHLLYALTLNPNNIEAHLQYSHFLQISGRHSEALMQLQDILLIDPLSFSTYKHVGKAFYRMGQFENSIIYLKESLELEPTDYVSLAVLGACLTELGKYEDAATYFEASLSIQNNIDILSMIGYLNARKENREQAKQIINKIESQTNNKCRYEIKIAKIYLALGDKEMTYFLLEQAFKQHEIDLVALRTDPRWGKINNEPKFKELVKRVGLPTT